MYTYDFSEARMTRDGAIPCRISACRGSPSFVGGEFHDYDPKYYPRSGPRFMASASRSLPRNRYNNASGPRMAAYPGRLSATIFHDVAPKDFLPFYYKIMNYEGSPKIDCARPV